MTSAQNPVLGAARGGRGARLRILEAATFLFYEEGINATGIERLIAVAHVSKRTFYQHFPSKAALVTEYLRRFDEEVFSGGEPGLTRADLSPRERLLSIFPADTPIRGCPFHNAAVETANTAPEVREAVVRHKRNFQRQLTRTAKEAGASAPEALARQLAVLFEGAMALSTSLGNPRPVKDARAAAALLVDAACAASS